MPYRVRQLIDSLELGALKKNKTIPNMSMFNDVPKKGGKFPKLAKQVSPSWLGIFIDNFIREVLTQNTFSIELLHKVIHTMDNYVMVEQDILDEYIYFKDIADWILVELKNRTHTTIEPEWTFENIQGHPDLVVDNIVYDIKMTGLFGKMRVNTIFQLLSYFALSQLSNNSTPDKITHIGLILPAQRLIVTIPIKNWDGLKLLNILRENSKKLEASSLVSPNVIYRYMQIHNYIGNHAARKGKILYKTILSFTDSKPKQIFLGSNIVGKHSYTESDCLQCLEHIINNNINLYIHAPYTLNLCSQTDDFVTKSLTEQFKTSKLIEAKGVVVHLGHKVNLDLETAYTNMRNNVINAVERATSACPLLLETDSGGSIMDSPIKLIEFYKDLPGITQTKVAICIDTCHVFAAGFDIVDSIKLFLKNKVPVKLIHFNDSKYESGSKKDRHKLPGQGLIGLSKLTDFAEIAHANGIPMLFE